MQRISRRKFLKTAIVSGIGITVLPSLINTRFSKGEEKYGSTFDRI